MPEGGISTAGKLGPVTMVRFVETQGVGNVRLSPPSERQVATPTAKIKALRVLAPFGFERQCTPICVPLQTIR